MRLSKAIREECIVARASYRDKDQALSEIAALAKRCPELATIPIEKLLDGFKQREALASTGIGDGIALPHCRIPGVNDFVVGVVTLEKPIDFDAIDGKTVSIIAFIVGPEQDTQEHPRILSGLSLRLGNAEGRKRLLAAGTGRELLDALDLATVKAVEPEQPVEKRMVYAIVQDADLFHRVLEAIASIDGSSAIVLDSTNANEHLVRLPVFASFLADQQRQFSRVIMAIVPRTLTNETVRRVEAVTGDLNARSDIAIVVHDVFLLAGALGV